MKNMRKHLLINPKFQIHFAVLFMIAVLGFSLIFPVFVFTIFDTLRKLTIFRTDASALLALQQARSDLLLFLVALAAGVSVSAFLLALFHSHRIAGPLYKLRISMIAMQQGVLDQHIRFREKDNFTELADGFNSMTDAIFIRRRKDFERVQSVIPKLERLQHAVSGEEQAAVTEILNALQELSRDLPMK